MGLNLCHPCLYPHFSPLVFFFMSPGSHGSGGPAFPPLPPLWFGRLAAICFWRPLSAVLRPFRSCQFYISCTPGPPAFLSQKCDATLTFSVVGPVRGERLDLFPFPPLTRCDPAASLLFPLPVSRIRSAFAPVPPANPVVPFT